MRIVSLLLCAFLLTGCMLPVPIVSDATLIGFVGIAKKGVYGPLQEVEGLLDPEMVVLSSQPFDAGDYWPLEGAVVEIG